MSYEAKSEVPRQRRGTQTFWRSRTIDNCMYFVYILKSQKDPFNHYIGITDNLEKRLEQHNRGHSVYTNKYRTWSIETYVAFSNKQLAENFEKYLKSGSGCAFLKKRLLEPC